MAMIITTRLAASIVPPSTCCSRSCRGAT
jgi:hypothetical protein